MRPDGSADPKLLDVQGAVEASNTAKTLCWISFGIGIVMAFFGFLSVFAGS